MGCHWGRKTNKHKEFQRDTPWCMSRLSHGHVPSVPSYVPSVPRTFCPLNWNFYISRPKRPGCPWDVPNFSLDRFRGVPITKFLHVTFIYRFFSPWSCWVTLCWLARSGISPPEHSSLPANGGGTKSQRLGAPTLMSRELGLISSCVAAEL